MCHQDHPAQSKTCEDHCSSDIAYSFEHFNHVDGDLLLTCEDLRHRKTVLVHKSRVLAMFPGLRKQFDASIKALPPNCAEITSSIVQVKEVGDSKDTKSEDGEMSDDGIIELHEGDDSTVIENIEQINLQGDKRSTDAQPVGHKPTLQEVTLSIQPEILGVMLAFVYGDVKLMDLSPHPQHIRGEVWEAAIQYRCPSLILYAESSILMDPDAITAPFAIDMSVKAKANERYQLFKALLPYTLRQDLLAACRNPTNVSNLCALKQEDLLDLAKFHVYAALYDEGYIRRAKANGIKENNLAIAAATAICTHNVKAQPNTVHPKSFWTDQDDLISQFYSRNSGWLHWPSVNARNRKWPSASDRHNEEGSGWGWGDGGKPSTWASKEEWGSEGKSFDWDPYDWHEKDSMAS